MGRSLEASSACRFLCHSLSTLHARRVLRAPGVSPSKDLESSETGGSSMIAMNTSLVGSCSGGFIVVVVGREGRHPTVQPAGVELMTIPRHMPVSGTSGALYTSSSTRGAPCELGACVFLAVGPLGA